jgi:predicted house-cleaning noncanonical NTP pyrophosphatase (MazG superfamily)
MEHYNKLIRDNVPQAYKRKGIELRYRKATTDEEYWFLLKQKLQEEVTELGQADTIENLIDIMDVIEAIIDLKKIDRKELGAIRENRSIEYGKFNARLVLESSSDEIPPDENQVI